MESDESAELEFVDGLPPWGGDKGYWNRSLEPLRKHPGVWAHVKARGKSVGLFAQAINTGFWGPKGGKKHCVANLPSGIWRAAVRGGKLYVCFCGERTEKR